MRAREVDGQTELPDYAEISAIKTCAAISHAMQAGDVGLEALLVKRVEVARQVFECDTKDGGVVVVLVTLVTDTA